MQFWIVGKVLSQRWSYDVALIEHFTDEVEVTESGGGCEWRILPNDFGC